MTNREFSLLEKQKQVFFVTQRMQGGHGAENMAYGLTIDCLLDNHNSYITLPSLSDEIKAKNIMLSPESLFDSLSNLNTSEVFENFPIETEQNRPFRLKEKIFSDFNSTADYISQLRTYVENFLFELGETKLYRDKIIDILLDSIFYCNIKFLKHIVAAKEEAPLQALLKTETYSDEISSRAYEIFNSLLRTSTPDFDEILRNIILRMFDFLSLNYNPKYAKRLEATFGGKFYYLDSSFIIRLLGFDGTFRKERSEELIQTLSSIKGVRFIVHEKSLEETSARIKELIGKNTKLLSKNPGILKSIFNRDEDGKRDNPVFTLFIQLFEKGRIRNIQDFSVYCQNIKSRMVSIIPNIEFDSSRLPKKLTVEREQLVRDLKNKTDKSSNRIKFITSFLDYIDSKRGANNYDIADIKYWLITTDSKTLSIDNQNIGSTEDNYCSSKKGICIMPSELIRMIDGFSGEIRSNHVGVFKNYMLKSHVFPQQYDEAEISTICAIATLVESTNLDEYKIDEMVERVLHNSSIKDIQKRLSRLNLQKEKDKELIDLFISRNEDLLDTKWTNMIAKARAKAEKKANRRWQCWEWSLVVVYILIICATVFNWNILQKQSEESFINLDIWGTIEFVIFICGILFSRLSPIVQKWKTRYIENFVQRELDDII